jgi:hypothetical protein
MHEIVNLFIYRFYFIIIKNADSLIEKKSRN